MSQSSVGTSIVRPPRGPGGESGALRNHKKFEDVLKSLNQTAEDGMTEARAVGEMATEWLHNQVADIKRSMFPCVACVSFALYVINKEYTAARVPFLGLNRAPGSVLSLGWQAPAG